MILLIFFTGFILVNVVNATEVETVEVGPRAQSSIGFNLDSGDRFSALLNLTGGSGDDINLWVTDPEANIIVDLGRVSKEGSIEFIADQDGTYILFFDNTFSSSSGKTVTLTYEVSQPFWDLDSYNLFLVFFAIALSVLVVLVLFFLSYWKHRRSWKKYERARLY